jgi:nucleoside-diphosphate-sugar epimerase
VNRILITGASGHIGSKLVDHLSQDHYVIGTTRRGHSETLVCMNTQNDIIEVIDLIQPNIIIHAGFPGVDPNTRNSASLLDGIRYSQALAEAAAGAAGVERLINLGSMSEYSISSHCLHENDCVATPPSNYGAAKVSAAALMNAALAESQTQFVHARLFNVYGPGEADYRLIPYLFQCVKQGSVPELSSGTQRRDFVYIDDAVKAISQLCDLTVTPNYIAYNVCTGISTPVADIIRHTYNAIGALMPALGASYRSNEFAESVGDPTRMQHNFGWTHTVDVQAGVYKAVEYLQLTQKTK